jgi:DNA polymerase-1
MENKSDRKILIVDVANLFIRNYCAHPAMDGNGQQIGGVVGFLKTLARLCDQIKPKAVYCCWESGGSVKRRAIFKDYKLNRKPEKMNRFYEDDLPDSDENKQYQMITLLKLLRHTPVCQLHVSDCEGDDVIAYLCRGQFKDENKVIVSSDRDMYQFLDDKTIIYNLHKKIFLTKEDILKEYRITAKNFALAKSICGDVSDNVPGVKGVGFKTLIKHLPFIGLEQDIILSEVFDYCAAHENESKVLKKILQEKEDIKRNWRLIYLDDHTLSNEQAKKVDYIIEKFEPKQERMEFMKLLARKSIDFDASWFFYSLGIFEK